MANTLTGDFDVVAQFGVLTVDRLLAGMHQTGRFLHSISVRIDDNPRPGHVQVGPTLVGNVDAFGDAVANQRSVGRPGSVGSATAADATYSLLGVLANPGLLSSEISPIVPSHIQGVAQLQLFPPTVVAPSSSGSTLGVRMNVMARFFPDKGTAPLAEFIRGDLQVTAPIIHKVRVIDIDFKSDQASITFTPSFSSQSLSPEDLAGITLCIQNGLRTSFLPSNSVLPSSIADVQLKTLPGVVAVLLDLNSHPSNAATVNTVFLGADDDFAFAVGRDYLLSVLRLISDNILSQQFSPATFTVDLSVWGVGTTLHYSYPIQINSAVFDLQPPDKIVLTIQGHAGPEPHGHPPSSFDFTVTVDFSLIPAGPTVALQVGNISVSTTSTLAGVVDFFTGSVTNSVRNAISSAIAATGANASVDQMFNANTNLGNFLNAQLNPSDGNPPAQPQQLFLVYNSIDIQQAGIVLHGSLLLFDWPAPNVEFEQIPSGGGRTVISPIFEGPDYSALKTWIPGGTIAQYEWSYQGQPNPFKVDPNTFVLLDSGPSSAVAEAYAAVPGYNTICLTARGTRISNYGTPPVFQNVSGSVCGFTIFTVAGVLATTGAAARPMLAITRPGLHGEVVVAGHTPAVADTVGSASPNLIVHFPDSKSLGEAKSLSHALVRSNRKDAPTAILLAVTAGQLAKVPFMPGIVYAEESDGAWQKTFGVTTAKRPLTLIVTPRGGVIWQKDGPIDPHVLTAALTRHLVSRSPIRINMPRLNTRIGQPAPNFLFEYAGAVEMPLRKLTGQDITLAFWKISSKPSIQAVRDLQKPSANGKGNTPRSLKVAASKLSRPPLVLAVNDGDDPEMARRVAAENGITATVVPDPNREIALAYGVAMWPTIVLIGASGAVTGIGYGHVPAAAGSPSKPAGAQP